jgi:hypothetical protein
MLCRAGTLGWIGNRLHWISSSLVKGPPKSGFVPRTISITFLGISTSAAGYRGMTYTRLMPVLSLVVVIALLLLVQPIFSIRGGRCK